MSNSSLISYTKISPNKTSPRNHVIDTVSIHCVVGQLSVETMGSIFAASSYQASSNYGIGRDGKIGMYVEEKDRSWCTSSASNDNRAITIEVASDTTHPYAVNSTAYAALIKLLVDICKRNGIKKLIWSTNKNERMNHLNGCNMTVHRDYANKACPGDYLYNLHGQIASEVNAQLGSSTTTATTAATSAIASSSSADAVIKVAVDEIGYLEKKSNSQLDDKTANSGSANYTKYARDFDEKYPNWYSGNKNGYAWCDMFVDWCFLTAFGYDEALRLLCQPERSSGASCTYSLSCYKQKGQLHTSNPKAGDQIFFGKSQSYVTHTGIVEKADNYKVYTIEGNTSDKVARRTYSLTDSSIVGYGRPAYGTAVSATATTVTAANQSVSTFNAYRVKITIANLYIRSGPGTNYANKGFIKPGVYTIVSESAGTGADKWGKLKSGVGWVALDYCTKLS